MDTDKMMQEAMHKAFADEILKVMDGPQREALLSRSIKEAISGWEFKHAVERVVQERAMQVGREVLASGKYDEEIRQAFISGLDLMMTQLPVAIQLTVQEAFFGDRNNTGGYGSGATSLGRHLKYPMPEKS